jgi:hypothetical protein
MNLRAFPTALFATAVFCLLVDGVATAEGVRIDLDAQAQPPPKQSAPAKSAVKSSGATTVTGTTSTTPGKAAPPPKNAKKEKKDEKPPKIDGLEVSRGDRGFLGIKVEDNTWKISFYNKEKKPVAADVAAIALRWPVQYQPNPERALLSPAGDGKVMSSDKTVRPPFTFTLYVTLLKDPSSTDQPAETYVVSFHQ